MDVAAKWEGKRHWPAFSLHSRLAQACPERRRTVADGIEAARQSHHSPADRGEFHPQEEPDGAGPGDRPIGPQCAGHEDGYDARGQHPRPVVFGRGAAPKPPRSPLLRSAGSSRSAGDGPGRDPPWAAPPARVRRSRPVPRRRGRCCPCPPPGPAIPTIRSGQRLESDQAARTRVDASASSGRTGCRRPDRRWQQDPCAWSSRTGSS